MYVCNCNGLTNTHIKKIIRDNKFVNLKQLLSIIDFQCGKCIPEIKEILKNEKNEI